MATTLMWSTYKAESVPLATASKIIFGYSIGTSSMITSILDVFDAKISSSLLNNQINLKAMVSFVEKTYLGR